MRGFALAVLRRDGVEVLGPALSLEVGDHVLDLVVGAERSVDAGDAPAAGHEEHVALAQQLLGAHLAQDRAAVDLRGHLEGDPGREVRLDRAGDHVHRRTLRRQIRWMPAARAIWARRWIAPSMSLPATIIRSAISSTIDHDVGQRLEVHHLVLVDRLAGLPVEAGLHRARDHLAPRTRLRAPAR